MEAQRGQTAVEYLGIVLVVAALLAVLLTAAPALGGAVAERVACAIQLSDCPGEAAPAEPPPAETPEQRAARELAERTAIFDRFRDAPLQEFLDEKERPGRDGRMDWSDDGCSAPGVGSTGASFDFTAACERHDFGYRNAKDLELFERRKDEIDRRFLADMLDHCNARGLLTRGRCTNWAYTFYAAVQAFG